MFLKQFSFTGYRAAVIPLLLALAPAISAQVAPAAQASAGPAVGKAAEILAGEEGLYRIGPGDVLEIHVLKHEELSLPGVRVDNNGFIRLPRVESDIKAACLSEKALAEEIKGQLWFLRRPDVRVAVKEYNSKPVAVIGAVNTPGRFQLQRQVRLLELMVQVNGPGPQAGKVIHVIHTAPPPSCSNPAGAGEGPDDPAAEFTEYDLEQTMRAVAAANPVIRPGDIVRVPDAPEVPRAYILGSVKNPQAIPLKDPVTVTQAIAIASGTAPGANTEKIKIIRQSPGSTTKTELLVSLKLVNRNRAEDVVLQPNDIVEVPGANPSKGKGILMGLGRILMPGAFPFPVQVLR